MYSIDEIQAESDLLLKLANKTVLVCGACGLIGSSLVEYLLQENRVLPNNVRVIASGRSLEKLKNRYIKYSEDKFLKLYPADIVDETAFFDLKEKIDYVIDCASPAHPIAYAKTPVDVLKSNILGSINLLDLCIKKKSRFLYVSSSEVYGQQVESNDIFFANSEEDYGYIDVLALRSCYPEGKRAAENLCIAYEKQFGCETVIVRFCQIYGAAVTRENTRADAQFLRKCIAKEDIELKSPGTQVRSMCYVKDAVTALLYVLINGDSANAYNVASKDSIASIRELAECMAGIAGVNVVFNYPQLEEQKGFSTISRAVINADKIEKLGWKAKYNLENGVKDMLKVASSS